MSTTPPITVPPAPGYEPADPVTFARASTADAPGVRVTLSPELAARFDPNAEASAQAAGDAEVLASLPAEASAYRPPERNPDEPAMDVEAIRAFQAAAFNVGATVEESHVVWRSTLRHQAQHPEGIEPDALALSSRTTLAMLERTLGADRVGAIKANADRVLARVHAGNPDLARLLRDAAVSDPLALMKLADVGRRLPALARKRRGR